MGFRRKLLYRTTTTLKGVLTDIRGIVVEVRGKPPKIRVQPNTYLELDGQLYIVSYIYRLVDEPSEWLYMLQEREDTSGAGPADFLGAIVHAAGVGHQVPRIVKDCFLNYMDAHLYFADIPRWGDGKVVSNQQIIKAKIISTGDLVHP